MKQHICKGLLALIGIFIVSTTYAQGIEFFHGSWEEAQKEAQKQSKIIFVDAFAVWCGPCKAMAKNLFPKEEVGAYFNSKFINVKIDMERGDGLKFRKKYPIEAFPTLYFISPKGELIGRKQGAPRTAEKLIEIAESITAQYNPAADYLRAYEEGARDYETMYNIVKSNNERGEPSLAFANEYLRTQDNLNTKENLMFLQAALVQVDTRIYDLYLEHYTSIEQLFTAEELQSKQWDAAMATVKTARIYDVIELKDEAIEKYGKLQPKDVKNFALVANLKYAEKSDDFDQKWLSTIQDKNLNPKTLILLIQDVDIDKMSAEQLKTATKALGKATKNAANFDTYYLLAQLQMQSGDNQAATQTLEKAGKMVEEGTKEADQINTLLKQMKDSK